MKGAEVIDMNIQDDNNIVDLFIARNEAAISCCSTKYGSNLRRVSMNVVNDEEIVKECENDTYLQAWNLIPPNEPRTYLFPFLAKIIRNISLDFCRKENAQKRKAIVEELSTELEMCIPDRKSDTEDFLENEALGKLISAYLWTLPEEQRKMFVRRYWYMDSIKDVSKMFCCTDGKVKSTLYRCREGLKHYLEKEGYHI